MGYALVWHLGKYDVTNVQLWHKGKGNQFIIKYYVFQNVSSPVWLLTVTVEKSSDSASVHSITLNVSRTGADYYRCVPRATQKTWVEMLWVWFSKMVNALKLYTRQSAIFPVYMVVLYSGMGWRVVGFGEIWAYKSCKITLCLHVKWSY